MSAKLIRVERVGGAVARPLTTAFHYSRKYVNNSQVHYGVRPDADSPYAGVLSFGPPMDRSKVLPLVAGSAAGDMMELNRMAFGPELPRNSESRALAVALRLLRAERPSLRWVLSFADGCQCGDGTIYRAAGFTLTGIKPNGAVHRLPNGRVYHHISLDKRCGTDRSRRLEGVAEGETAAAFFRRVGATRLPGFMLRYVYFYDRADAERLTVPALPYSAIEAAGASMHRGVPSRRKHQGDAPGLQPGKGGSIPTPTLGLACS